jgi:hypothetical protein
VGGRVDVSPGQVGNIFERGRQLAENFGDSNSLLRLHENMAARLGWSGDFEGQRQYLNAATRIADEVPDPEIRLDLLQRCYVAELHQGDLKSALTLIDEGITGCKASQSEITTAVYSRLFRSFLLARANVLSMMGRLTPAGTLIDQAAGLMPSTDKSKPDSRTTHTGALVRTNLSGGKVMRPYVRMCRAELAKVEENDDTHRKMLNEAHRLFKSMGAYGHAERLDAKIKSLKSASG